MYHVSPNMHKLQQLHYPKSGPKKLPYPKFHFTRDTKHIWIILEFTIAIVTAMQLAPVIGTSPQRKGFQTVSGLLLLQPVGQAPAESVGILSWQTPGKHIGYRAEGPSCKTYKLRKHTKAIYLVVVSTS